MVGRNTLDVAIEVRILEGEFFYGEKLIYKMRTSMRSHDWFERERAEAMWRKR